MDNYEEIIQRKKELKKQIRKEFRKPIFIIGEISMLSLPVIAWLGILGLVIWWLWWFLFDNGSDPAGWALIIGIMLFAIIAPALFGGTILSVLHTIFMNFGNGIGGIITMAIYTLVLGGGIVTEIVLAIEAVVEGEYVFSDLWGYVLGGNIILIAYIVMFILHIAVIICTCIKLKKVKPLKMEIKELSKKR